MDTATESASQHQVHGTLARVIGNLPARDSNVEELAALGPIGLSTALAMANGLIDQIHLARSRTSSD
jgi:hypothetical protein